MNKKKILLIGVLITLIVVILIYNYISDSSKTMMKLGGSDNWRIEAFIENNKDIYIFRPTLYPKFYPNNSLEIKVMWNLNEKLLISDVNSPKLTGSYSFSEFQAKNLPDIPLQHFNFLNGNRKEIYRLLSQSSIDILWKQGNGELKKDTIFLKCK
jgi:hypothetical protein